jgi:hypothetical protein
VGLHNLRKKRDTEGGGGFNPRIRRTASTGPLGPDACLHGITSETKTFSAACSAPRNPPTCFSRNNARGQAAIKTRGSPVPAPLGLAHHGGSVGLQPRRLRPSQRRERGASAPRNPAHPSFKESSTRRSRAQTQARTQSLIRRTLHTHKGHHKPTYRF